MHVDCDFSKHQKPTRQRIGARFSHGPKQKFLHRTSVCLGDYRPVHAPAPKSFTQFVKSPIPVRAMSAHLLSLLQSLPIRAVLHQDVHNPIQNRPCTDQVYTPKQCIHCGLWAWGCVEGLFFPEAMGLLNLQFSFPISCLNYPVILALRPTSVCRYNVQPKRIYAQVNLARLSTNRFMQQARFAPHANESVQLDKSKVFFVFDP